jgi:hypothetical protein
MHLQDPYVASPADHLGYVTMTIDDQDGTEPRITVRAEIRLMDDNQNEVAARTGDPHYMPEDWQDRAIALVQELRAATALIHDVSAAPPPDPEE